jgi:hypothetical protein
MFKHSYAKYHPTSYMQRNGVPITRVREPCPLDDHPDRTIIRTNQSSSPALAQKLPSTSNSVPIHWNPRLKCGAVIRPDSVMSRE